MTREERAERVLGLLDNRKSQPFPRSVKHANGSPISLVAGETAKSHAGSTFWKGKIHARSPHSPAAPRMRLGCATD